VGRERLPVRFDIDKKLRRKMSETGLMEKKFCSREKIFLDVSPKDP
jgi:hypothetical protein